MEAMLLNASLGGNPLLAGLVEQYGGQAVANASVAVHGFPASLISSMNEATALVPHLDGTPF
jgi:hypothetical protein